MTKLVGSLVGFNLPDMVSLAYSNSDHKKLPNLLSDFPSLSPVSENELKLADITSDLETLIDDIKDIQGVWFLESRVTSLSLESRVIYLI